MQWLPAGGGNPVVSIRVTQTQGIRAWAKRSLRERWGAGPCIKTAPEEIWLVFLETEWLRRCQEPHGCRLYGYESLDASPPRSQRADSSVRETVTWGVIRERCCYPTPRASTSFTVRQLAIPGLRAMGGGNTTESATWFESGRGRQSTISRTGTMVGLK